MNSVPSRGSKCRSSPVGISAGLLSSDERLTEIAEILANGLLRSRLKSSPKAPDCVETPLDFSPNQSGHPEDSTSENVG